MIEVAEKFWLHLFQPTHLDAPAFWNMAFLYGTWSLMLGSLYWFEKLTRNLRKWMYAQPKSSDLLVKLHLLSRTNAERLSEWLMRAMGRVGLMFWLFGLILTPIGIFVGIWSSRT